MSDMRTMGDKVHSHNSNCIYSKSNGNSIEFSLSNANKGAVGFIPALEIAILILVGLFKSVM